MRASRKLRRRLMLTLFAEETLMRIMMVLPVSNISQLHQETVDVLPLQTAVAQGRIKVNVEAYAVSGWWERVVGAGDGFMIVN